MESKLFDGVTREVVPLSGDVLDDGQAEELPNGNLPDERKLYLARH